MSRPTRATVEGRAYLDVKRLAVSDGRSTDEMHHLYVLECFLARLATTKESEHLILKGGALLAAFGTRRPTRDVDLQAGGIPSDADAVLALVRAVASVRLGDGVVFDCDGARAELIRDGDEFNGVRVGMMASLARARVVFHVDVNIGDPVWPAPQWIKVPRLLGGHIRLLGYPLHMVHAEKIVTAVERGTFNTRWRDFGDIWTLSSRHAIVGSDLQRAIEEVSTFRRVELKPLSVVLDGFAADAQARWALWRRRLKRDDLPTEFAQVLDRVVSFADQPLLGEAATLQWSASAAAWG